MTPELITRVISLVQKQGDKIVLADSATGKAVVLMDLTHYEQLIASAEAALSESVMVSAPIVAPVAVAPAPIPLPEPESFAGELYRPTPASEAPVVEPVRAPAPQPIARPVVAPPTHAAGLPTPMRAVLERLATPTAAPQTVAPAQAASVAQPPVNVGPRVEAAIKAPELSPKRLMAEGRHPGAGAAPAKPASAPENAFARRARELGVENTPTSPLNQAQDVDLTQGQLLDKINRDIGDWKTAQERKRSEDLATVTRAPALAQSHAPVAEAMANETFDAMEDEERFYLEPIE